MRRAIFLIVAIALVTSIGITTGTAHAYPVASGSSGLPTFGTSTSILAPFESFFKSMNSVSIVGPSVGAQSIPQNDFVINEIQHGFQWFDNWLYGIAGFHISGLFTAILSMFSWLLDFIKGGVDWLLSVVH